MNDEGLADAKAANPFALPRLHPGIGSSAWLEHKGSSSDSGLLGFTTQLAGSAGEPPHQAAHATESRTRTLNSVRVPLVPPAALVT